MSSSDIAHPKSTVYATLDAWRGFACLAVVLDHATVSLGGEHPVLQTLALYRLASHGKQGVHIFFVISGYCVVTAAISTLRRGKGVRSYVWSRVRRIYPPYWVSVILLLITATILAMVKHSGGHASSHLLQELPSQMSPASLLANLLLIQVPFRKSSLLLIAWTLSYEVAFYAIIAIFLLTTTGPTSERRMLNGLHAFTLTCLFVLLFVPRYAVYPINLWAEFGLGILVYDIAKHPKHFAPWAFGLAAVSGMVGLISMLSALSGHAGAPSVTQESCVTALGFAILISLLYKHDQFLSRLRPVRFLSFVGAFSYSLYLVHLLAVGLVLWAFKRMGMEFRLHYLYVAVATIFSLPVAYIFYRYFERPFISSRMRSRVAEVAPALADGPVLATEFPPLNLVS
jgi:exopolysaccharide production protein ExoZ